MNLSFVRSWNHAWLVGPVLAAGLMMASTEARAASSSGLDACGNIDVEANLQCQVQKEGGCEAQCTPVNLQLACSAQLQAQCDGQCQATLPSCNVDCEADCGATCNVNPGNLDCSANCQASCDADCSSTCAGNANGAQCQASCKATCGAHCDASCTGTPPSATCQAKCQASCQGSCSGRANLKCQVDCQSNLYAKCEADLTGGCQVQCQKPSGALFCEGQFVDTGDNLETCREAIEAYLKAHFSASGSASCVGNSCQAEGTVSSNCDVAGGPGAGSARASGAVLVVGLGAIAGSLARRRRARR